MEQVISVREQGIFSAEDSFILALALTNQATLVTRDVEDFSKLAHLVNEPHYGIILLRPDKSETREHINFLLANFLERYSDLDLVGRIVVISPKRIRFRPPLK